MSEVCTAMEYEEFVMTVRRDINCLSGDRNLMRNAFVRLDGIVKGGNVSDEVLCRLFVEELHMPLFRLFDSKIYRCCSVGISCEFVASVTVCAAWPVQAVTVSRAERRPQAGSLATLGRPL